MGILEGLLITCSALIFGLAVIRMLDADDVFESWETVAAALLLGLILFGFFVLGAALVTNNLRIGITLGYFAAGAVFFAVRGRIFSYFHSIKILKPHISWRAVGLMVMLIAYWGILWQVMIWSEAGLPFSILKGWGDGAYHLDIIARLATANPFQLDQPIASGQPLTYPLLIDFLSAIFQRVGISDAWAWHVPVFLLGTAFFWIVYAFGKRVLGNRMLAAALVFLILFGGGIGFWWFLKDIGSAYDTAGIQGVAETLANPPHEYTHLDSRTGGKPQGFDVPYNIVWIVPAVSFFSHQRSFIAGAGLSILIFLGVWLYRKRFPVLPGWLALIGFLPFSHTHSFFSGVLIAIVLFFGVVWKNRFRDWKALAPWVIGGTIALLIALPQVLFLSQTGFLGEGAGSSFFKPWLGWMTCTHSVSWFLCDPGVPGTDGNPFWFWMKNFGVVFIVWIAATAFFWKQRNESAARFFLAPSIVMFSVPNLILLQPWEFDNNKALFYWWFFAALLSLAFLKAVLEKKSFRTAIIVLFLLAAGLSGSIDVLVKIKNGIIATIAPGTTKYHFTYYGEAEREIAEWIRNNTRPNDAFLTVDWANQSVPMLTGRAIYLGFPGWLWTQGRGALVSKRQETIRQFAFSGDAAGLCEDGIDYWLSEPAFFINYPTPRQDLESIVGTVRYEHPSGRKIIQLPCETL